jgi:hypothetical protein
MRLANLVPVAVAAALLATVGVIYVARGGGDSLDPVAAAATKTAGAGGYHLSIDADFTAAGRHVTVIGDGVADPAAQRAELTMRLAGSLTPAAPANAATDLVMTGDVMYMKVPTASGALGGKSWLKLDLSKVTNVGTNAQPVQQLDPTQWLQALRASAGVRRVGTDTVQGEQMTHYRGLVDLADSAKIPAGARSQVDAEAKTLGLSTIPVDVWVDAGGVVRRETLSLDGNRLQMTMTLDLSDVGSPVSVAAPPGSQVLDITPLAAGARP